MGRARKHRNWSYMGFEKVDANVHTLNHVEEVCLENERLPRVIEQTRRVL
jgi:hypothetical protein